MPPNILSTHFHLSSFVPSPSSSIYISILLAAMAEPNKYEMSPQIQQPPYQISGFPKNFLPRFVKREESQLNLELSLQCQITAEEENNVPKLKKVKEYQMVESGKEALDSMPIVITRGKEIQGILYSQNPVKIVCICHAKFFSPDEFVQHATGGGSVLNSLQYITVLTKQYIK